MSLIKSNMSAGGWTMGANFNVDPIQGKRSSILMDQSLSYQQNLADSESKWKAFNKANTLTSDVVQVQPDMNIDILGFEESLNEA